MTSLEIIRADLHGHVTNARKVEDENIIPFIDVASERLGKGGMVGLGNFSDRRYELFADHVLLAHTPGYERVDVGGAVYFPEKDLWVVKGQEIPMKPGKILPRFIPFDMALHLYILGIEKGKHIKPGMTLDDTLKAAEDLNGTIVIDHPCSAWGLAGIYGLGSFLKRNMEYLDRVHGWEVHNGEAGLLPGANRASQRMYNRIQQEFPNVAPVITSDHHTLDEVGTSYMNLPKPGELRTAEDVSDYLQRAFTANKDMDLGGQRQGNAWLTFKRLVDHAIRYRHLKPSQHEMN